MPSPKSFTIACLSDLHLNHGHLNHEHLSHKYLGNQHFNDKSSRHIFEQVLALVLADEPDFLLLTGDLVNDGVVSGYDYLIDILTKSKRPFALLAGNHDVATESPATKHQAMPHHERQFIPVAIDNRLIINQIFDVGAWQIVCIATAVAGCEHGHLTDATLAWLDDILNKNKKHTLLAMHHHPIPVGSRWIDALMLDNADKLFALLQKHPHCHAVVCGHVHQACDKLVHLTHVDGAIFNQNSHSHTHDGQNPINPTAPSHPLRLLTSPACSRQFLPFSDDFALDTIHAGYRQIRLYPSGQLETMVKRLSD